jgi:hypothetical protein
MVRVKNGIIFRRVTYSNLNEYLLGCFFFLAVGGATRDVVFLLLEDGLVRTGSDVAYLAIS